MTPTAPFILELNIKPSILVFPAALAAFKTLHNRDKSADKHNVVSVKLSSARKHQKLTAQGNSWIITSANKKKGVLDAHANCYFTCHDRPISIQHIGNLPYIGLVTFPICFFFLIHVALYKLEFINSKLLRETEKKRLTRRLSKGLKMWREGPGGKYYFIALGPSPTYFSRQRHSKCEKHQNMTESYIEWTV